MSTNGNESAFPWTPTNAAGQCSDCVPGLTKRELFAAMAMHAMMANPSCADMSANEVFVASINSADRLIAELSKAAQ